MARPPVIQKLRHNRLLCGSVFRWFVETWNWLTAYVDNLKGDGELNGQSGCITVDRTDPDAPVIRLDINKLPVGGGGGGGLASVGDGPFTPILDTPSSESDDPPQTVNRLENCYYQIGGRTILMSNWTAPQGTSGLVALRVSADPTSPGASVQVYANLAALQAAQEDTAYVITPLYIMSGSVITLDMRRTPFIQLAEVF